MRNVNERMTKTAVAGRYIGLSLAILPSRSALNSTRPLVDSLPFLNHLPKALAPWKQEADDLFLQTLKLFKGHVDDVSLSSLGLMLLGPRWDCQWGTEGVMAGWGVISLILSPTCYRSASASPMARIRTALLARSFACKSSTNSATTR